VSQTTVEVDTAVELTATVEDLESTADKLIFSWSATAGTFTGEGAKVTWKGPADLATPTNVTLTLTVRERYPALDELGQLVTKEHSVTGTATVRVHNSTKELSEMGLSFLNKFATSSVSPEACLVDFSDSCNGKRDELRDIENNRDKFIVLDSSLGTPHFTALAPYDSAEMLVSCSFQSRIVKCLPGETSCVVGATEEATGDCRLTAVYEQERWWLCDSRFLTAMPLTPMMREFFRLR
jgi:hypothetical protein